MDHCRQRVLMPNPRRIAANVYHVRISIGKHYLMQPRTYPRDHNGLGKEDVDREHITRGIDPRHVPARDVLDERHVFGVDLQENGRFNASF
jgi:hypothetical protein